jgi:hypothetical protein
MGAVRKMGFTPRSAMGICHGYSGFSLSLTRKVYARRTDSPPPKLSRHTSGALTPLKGGESLR